MPISHEELVQTLIEERIKLQAFIRSIVPDYHMAEDVFQEVSVLALRSAADINDREHLLAWVRRSARHRAINAAKKANRRTLSLDEDLGAMLEESWQRLDDRPVSDTSEALEKCLGLLPPFGRRLIHLRYTEGLTGDQLAKQVGRSTSSTYVTLSRVHSSLAKCIRERLGRKPRGGKADA
ncbi:MAG: sigma-70 family RNA polymerase sigma factor [Phycisphaerales bacterium JB063]